MSPSIASSSSTSVAGLSVTSRCSPQQPPCSFAYIKIVVPRLCLEQVMVRLCLLSGSWSPLSRCGGVGPPARRSSCTPVNRNKQHDSFSFAYQ